MAISSHPRKSAQSINLPDKYSHLPIVPRACLLALEHFNYDAKKAAEVLGIPARSVWSSQDLVETFALLLEVGLEVIRADAR